MVHGYKSNTEPPFCYYPFILKEFLLGSSMIEKVINSQIINPEQFSYSLTCIVKQYSGVQFLYYFFIFLGVVFIHEEVNCFSKPTI